MPRNAYITIHSRVLHSNLLVFHFGLTGFSLENLIHDNVGLVTGKALPSGMSSPTFAF